MADLVDGTKGAAGAAAECVGMRGSAMDAVGAATVAGWRFITTHAPTASIKANPIRIGQRYCCKGSGASMGAPSPPPGRLSRPWPCWAAPDATCAGDSEIVPVPLMVKGSD